MAGLCAPARERLLLAHHPREPRPPEVRALPRKSRDHRRAAPLSTGPHQRLLARYLGRRRPPRHDDGWLRRLPPPGASRIQLPGLSQVSVPQMKTTRTNVFQFAGGALAGTLFTPAPWRLITDSALWGENCPGVPRPLRRATRAKCTNCHLCTAASRVRPRRL